MLFNAFEVKDLSLKQCGVIVCSLVVVSPIGVMCAGHNFDYGRDAWTIGPRWHVSREARRTVW